MARTIRILHLLSQRPGRTGSGTTLDSLVRCAAKKGYDQHAVVGTPGDDPSPSVGGLAAERIHPLMFDQSPIEFPLPGMSDVMPYVSSVFSQLSPEQVEAYSAAWRAHLRRVIEQVQPDLIHAHHLWLMSSLVKEIAPQIPLVVHCHATGLRQMELVPHLVERVQQGVAQADHLLALTEEHEARMASLFPNVPRSTVGAGFREAIFTSTGRAQHPGPTVVYAGKYSRAKGLPWLLDAVEQLGAEMPEFRLHVAGTGAGEEADALRARMETMAPQVVLHGQLTPDALADVMRQSALFVLPSFYEGLPLVLVEAVATGCRAVATKLPGVQELAAKLGDAIRLIDLPRLSSVDQPFEEDTAAFVARLRNSIETALVEPSQLTPNVRQFTWDAVFARIELVWERHLATS